MHRTLQFTISNITAFIWLNPLFIKRLSLEIPVQTTPLYNIHLPRLARSPGFRNSSVLWEVISAGSPVRNHTVNFTHVAWATLNHTRQFQSWLLRNQCFCCRNWISCQLGPHRKKQSLVLLYLPLCVLHVCTRARTHAVRFCVFSKGMCCSLHTLYTHLALSLLSVVHWVCSQGLGGGGFFVSWQGWVIAFAKSQHIQILISKIRFQKFFLAVIHY